MPRRGRRASSRRSSTTSRSAIRIINSRVRAAGLHGLLGYTGETNVQGEEVQKLDEFANETLLNVLGRSGHCGVIASEELERGARSPSIAGKYVMVFDPLDGSSNIDDNISIGTIFASSAARPERLANASDLLLPGHDIVAAGYVLYGIVDDGRPLDGAGRARRSRSTRTSASSSSRTRTSAARPRQLLLDQRGQLRALDRPRPQVEHVDQGRGQGARAARTASATSARSSPTRTARS